MNKLMSNKFWPAWHNQGPEGVYRPATIGEARIENGKRANAYEQDVQAYIKGELSKDQIFRSFNEPIYGAFGEKL